MALTVLCVPYSRLVCAIFGEGSRPTPKSLRGRGPNLEGGERPGGSEGVRGCLCFGVGG